MTDKGPRKTYEAIGNPSLVHQFPCQHEKGNRQQWKRVNPVDKILGDNGKGNGGWT